MHKNTRYLQNKNMESMMAIVLNLVAGECVVFGNLYVMFGGTLEKRVIYSAFLMYVVYNN
jgi:hypothetical protein